MLEGPAFGAGTSRLAWALPDDGTGVLDLSVAKSVPHFAAFGDDESEDEEIVVKGNRTKNTGTGDETGGGYGDGSYGDGTDGPGIGDGGSGDQPIGESREIPHPDKCSTADGSAVQIARKIQTTDDIHPVEFSWKDAEYGTLVVNTGSGFGAFNDVIYTRGLLHNPGIPLPPDGIVVEGVVHNHPDAVGDDRLDDINRYPSNPDWIGLQNLYNQYSGVIPNYDPSLWIIDSDGVVREFKYSEMSQFYGEAMTNDQRAAGVGLEGRERSQSCGSSG